MKEQQQFFKIDAANVTKLYEQNKSSFNVLNTPFWIGADGKGVEKQLDPAESIQHLTQGVNDLLDIIAGKEIDKIIWLDTSVRPLKRITNEVRRQLYPIPLSTIENFLNIGTTTRIDDLKDPQYKGELDNLRKAMYFETIPQNVLIADHYVESGGSLCRTFNLLNNTFVLQNSPKEIHLYGGFDQEAFWFTQPEVTGLNKTPKGVHRPLFLDARFVRTGEDKKHSNLMARDIMKLADYMVKSATPTERPTSFNLLDIIALRDKRKQRVNLL